MKTNNPESWKQHNREQREEALGELGLLIADNEDALSALSDVIDNYFVNNDGGYEAAKGILSTLRFCNNDEERFIAEMMLIAIFGWSFATLTNDLKHVLAENYGADVKYDKERQSGLFGENSVLDCVLNSETSVTGPSPVEDDTEGNRKFIVPVRGGKLLAEASTDPDNPGVSICFTSSKHPDSLIDVVYIENTEPELLPKDAPKREDVIRTLCYADPWNEDYTHEHRILVEDVDKALAASEAAYNLIEKTACNENGEPSSRTAIDILWDTDGDQELLASLPEEINIPDSLANEEISDYISDVTGFCHKGFVVKCTTKEEK